MFYSFFFNDTATTEIYTLSLHDALPISQRLRHHPEHRAPVEVLHPSLEGVAGEAAHVEGRVCHSGKCGMRNAECGVYVEESSHRSSRRSGTVIHLGPPPPRTSSLPSIVITARWSSRDCSSASRVAADTIAKPACSSSCPPRPCWRRDRKSTRLNSSH